jgi:tetratricopeptide (TPR) repeat protein
MVGLAMAEVQVAAALMTDDLSSLAPNHAGDTRFWASFKWLRGAWNGVECEQALTLDRNLAYADAAIGFAKYLLGRAAEIEARISEAFGLSPRDTLAHRWMVWVGLVNAQLNNDTEAVLWLRRGLDANRNYSMAHFLLAAALARLGELDHAAVQAELELDPSFTVRHVRSTIVSSNPTYLAGRERSIEGMRKAGVPEG